MLRILDRLEEIIIATLIAAATLLIFVAVVHRYGMGWAGTALRYGRANDIPWLFDGGKAVFNALRQINLVWAQDLCIYMFVWMAKFGAAYGVRTGIHVGVDVLINRLSPEKRKFFVMFGLLAGAFFTGMIAAFGARFVWHMAHGDSVWVDLNIPYWIVYLAIPLGSSLMCFRFLQVAWSFWNTGELPHVDHGAVDGLEDENEGAAPNLHPKGANP